ncbi:MAG TPA: acetyl-CoA carboxylase biotin carboxyl carrier protein subunit [Solirubrobacterales bacterium]
MRFAPAADDAGAAHRGEGTLEAPMPGTVVQLRVEAGATVAEGETLVVLESMKMEISIASPRDGTVATVLVAAGDQVDRGAVLIELAEEPVDLGSPVGDQGLRGSHGSVTDERGDE